MIESNSNPNNNEVVITDADLVDRNKQVSTTQERTQMAKRLLPDKSEIETMTDGYGNKTETRFFKEHPRLRCVILRTSAEGNQEVTVYGFGSDTKVVADLGDKALTASGDEIANAAQLTVTRGTSETPNFMKKRSNQTSLQPLPSSAFQKPRSQVIQPNETVEPETADTSENSPKQPSPEEED